MSISLQRGERYNLSHHSPGLKKIFVGLGWEMKPGALVDLDVSVFMLDRNAKLPDDEYFVFYNNLKSPDGAVQHTGDNRRGDVPGDDEMILAHLPLVDLRIQDMLFIASIYEAKERRHTFGMLHEAFIRIVDVDANREILRFNLGTDYPNATEMEFGRLHRENGEWVFIASGTGTAEGLQTYVDRYAL